MRWSKRFIVRDDFCLLALPALGTLLLAALVLVALGLDKR